MPKQRSHLNSLLINMDNKCNEFLSLFSPFDKEFFLRKRLIDFFSDHFSFYFQTQDIKNYFHNLDNIIINTSSDSYSSIIIFDTSIRNNIATSILYIHIYNKLIIKTTHHMVNVTTTKAKLFAIRCSINQAVSILNIKHIVIITDLLYAAKKIFESSLHPYQIYSAAISHKLREFFKKNNNNRIEFWNCPSNQNWLPYFKDTKSFNLFPIFPCKSSWNFYKKCNCNFIILQ